MEVVRRQQARQDQFEKEIREAVARLETRKLGAERSPRGGLEFEDAVIAFLARAAAGSASVLEVTGLTVGEVGRSKKGDAVLRFGAESAFAGAGVVFEAKREAGYTVPRALDELDAARKNRNAGAGVFVLARSHAGPGFPPFVRYGNNVLVTWDEEDPAFLAVCLGAALVTRHRTAGDAGDISALRDVGGAHRGRTRAPREDGEAQRRHPPQLGRHWRRDPQMPQGVWVSCCATPRRPCGPGRSRFRTRPWSAPAPSPCRRRRIPGARRLEMAA